MINWQIYALPETSSTNDAIKEYCNQKGQYIALRAVKQTAGRGRLGRKWQSLDGNLFFSMALEISLKNLGMLIVCASLSLWQTIKKMQPSASVCLKWPNDVLLNGAKVSGMLLEKGSDEYIIIGIGVNIVQHPDSAEMLYPTTSLAKAGINTTAQDFMMQYLQQFSHNFERMQNGEEALLRQQWTACAKGVGRKISVRQGQTEQIGIFKGIDENAHLLLEKENEICHIRVGDVFYIEKEI